MKRVFKCLAVVTMAVGFVSCGKNTPVADEAVEFLNSNIIVGSVDWKEVTELSNAHPIRISSRAVADVQFANGGRCTGFMVADDVLMTNQHCVRSASDVVGMKVYMKHEKGVSKANWAEVKCDEFIGNDYALDFALVKCQGAPGARYGKVELDSNPTVEGEDVYVVHQNCDYYTDYDCDWSKKYSEGKVVDVQDEVGHNADTLGGSSGSPLFSANSNKVIAIHHAGYGNDGNGRGFKNYAVPMNKIVPFIEAKFPGVLGGASDDTGSDDSAGDSSDDNNTFATATSLGNGKKLTQVSITGASDVDVYEANMKKGEVFSFKIFFKHAEGDLDFKLYKKVGSSVKHVKTKESSTDNESIRLRVASNTTYFVKVFGYNGAKAKYKVEFKKK